MATILTNTEENERLAQENQARPARSAFPKWLSLQAPPPRGWKYKDDGGFHAGVEPRQWLELKIYFPEFVSAFAFASKVALLAERRKHHPDMTIGYNYVTLVLTTHAAGTTLTPADYKLAQEITQLPEVQMMLGQVAEQEAHLREVAQLRGE
jgi:4a-hydroxytetrahydrobiopterin dehydratase